MKFLSKTDSRILWAVKILLGFCLLTPLLMSSVLIFPYTAPKAFAFRILVELAAMGYFYLVLKYSNFRPNFLFCHPGLDPESRIKKSGCRIKSGMTISVAVLIFLFVSFLSAIFGVDFYSSWWGSLERMTGVWGLLHFGLFFLMLSAVFKTKNDWRTLIKISVGVSAAVALLAVVQRMASLGNLLPQAERVFSTIGNAGYLASYLIFNVFLAVYLLMSPGGRRPQLARLNLGLAILLQLAALLLTGTRGAWLGLAVGVIIFFVLLIFSTRFFNSPHPNPPLNKGRVKGGVKKWPIAILAVIFFLFIALFFARDTDFVKNNSVLSRAASISLKDTTAQSRLLLWQKAWQAWQQKPLLGWGPENFSVAANKYADARLTSQEAYDFDRAHNFIFDYGVAGGWLGLLAYLGMIGAAFWGLIMVVIPARFAMVSARRAKAGIQDSRFRLKARLAEAFGEGQAGMTEKDNFFFFVIFVSLLIAYLVQNLFIFDTFVSYLMLFFALALVSSFWQGYQSREEEGKKSLNLTKKIIISFSVFCFLFSVFCYNLKPMLASYRAGEILALPPANAQQAATLLKDALGLKTFASGEIVYQSAVDYIIKIDQSPALADNEDFYQASSAGLKEAVVRSPSQARNYVALAWLKLYFSNQHPEAFKEVLELAKKIKELSPAKKDVYLILAADYALQGDKALGEQTVVEAQQISPIIGEEVKEYWESLK